MKKLFPVFLLSLSMFLSSCLMSVQRSPTLPTAINALHYSGDALNKKLADDIINGKIKISYTTNIPGVLAYSIKQDTKKINMSYSKPADLESAIEEGVIISYFGYIKYHSGEQDVLENALDHAKKTLVLMLDNYLTPETRPKYTNAKQFLEYIKNKKPESDRTDQYQLTSTTSKFTNGILVHY